MEALGASKVFPQIQNESKKQKKKIEDGLQDDFSSISADFYWIWERFGGARGSRKWVQNRIGLQGPKRVEFLLNFH